jgi:hypothetical protein
MITNDARCTHETKFRIAMAKAAVNKKKDIFTRKLDLNKEETSKMLHLEDSFVWC